MYYKLSVPTGGLREPASMVVFADTRRLLYGGTA